MSVHCTVHTIAVQVHVYAVTSEVGSDNPANVYTTTRVHCDLKDDPDVHVYTMTWKVTLMYTCTCTMTWNVTLVYMCIVYTLTLV